MGTILILATSSRIVGATGAVLGGHGLVITNREYVHMPSMSKSISTINTNADNIDEFTNYYNILKRFPMGSMCEQHEKTGNCNYSLIQTNL